MHKLDGLQTRFYRARYHLIPQTSSAVFAKRSESLLCEVH